MRSLRSKLPPMKTLVAFEAVARHLSVTRAAEELGITREAVSRQIRILEEHLGVRLLDRLHRAVALTQDGQQFQTVVARSLENIAELSAALQRKSQTQKISVAATVAIASFWLTPRLARFHALCPELEIGVSVSDSVPDMLSEDIDVSLRYGDGRWPGVTATRLFDTDTFPVCSPDYCLSAPPLATPADLLQHNLINLDGEAHAAEDWSWWLKGNGVSPPPSLRFLSFDNYANVIQIALDGQGVALGYGGLISDLLAQGKLVRPLDEVLSRSQAVYAVVSAQADSGSRVGDFVDWLLQEAERSNP